MSPVSTGSVTISSSILISNGVLVKCCLESSSVWICLMFPHIRPMIGFREEDSKGVISFPSHHVDIAGYEKRGPRPRSCLLDFYFAKLLLFPLITLLIGKQVTKCSLYWRGCSLIPIKLKCV